MSEDVKRASAFCFEPGVLTVLRSGYGERNGSATLQFNEDDVTIYPHDDRDGNFIQIDVDRSELVALRDFLNKELPRHSTGVEAAVENILAGIEAVQTIIGGTSPPTDFGLESAEGELTRVSDLIRALPSDRGEVEGRKLSEALDMIELILPMAKGYAYVHPVGSNAQYVQAARDFVERARAATGKEG
jgi:hypothetical protein